MATINVKVPIKPLILPVNWVKTRGGVTDVIQKTWDKYGDIIKKVSELTKVSPEIITCFIAVENTALNEKESHGSTAKILNSIVGLMQWNRVYAWEGLEIEKNKGRLSKAEEEMLNSYGIFFKANSKGVFKVSGSAFEPKVGIQTPMKLSVAINPRLNILIGAIKIGQMSDSTWANVGGEFRLDRVIVGYNTGLFSPDFKTSKASTDISYYKKLNSETEGYLHKMLGKDGALDVATSDLKTLFS